MAIAGKVAITPKGNWNANTAYQKLDLVYYNNGSYVAIQPSTGVTPTNTAYWMLVVQSASGADLEAIINGTTQVGNAQTLDGHGAEYFAPLADLSNYLPLTGGRIDGNGAHPFAIRGSYASIYLDFENSTDELVGAIGFEEANKPVFVNNAYNAVYPLLHTGNKPTGSYTGNGSAEQRIIATNGIGKVCVVNGGGRTAYVSIWGAIILSGTSVTGLDYTKMNFNNGNLKVATTEYINDSGETYTWDVL